MRSRLSAFLVVLSVAGVDAAAVQQSTRRPTQPPDATFKQLIGQYCTAWSTRDPSSAAWLYASKDVSSEYYWFDSPKFTGWPALAEGAKASLAEFTAFRLTPANDLKVARKGTTAVTTVTLHLTARSTRRGDVDLDLRHTAVWDHRGSDWLITHEHLSVPWKPAPPETPPPSPADEEQIRALFAQYATAWNSGDSKALADLWTPDGDVGSLETGTATAGRAAIERMWAEMVSRRGATATFRLSNQTSAVRFLGPEAALVDGVFEYASTTPAGRGRELASTQEHYTAVVKRVDGRWGILSIRVATKPTPPPPQKR